MTDASAVAGSYRQRGLAWVRQAAAAGGAWTHYSVKSNTVVGLPDHEELDSFTQ